MNTHNAVINDIEVEIQYRIINGTETRNTGGALGGFGDWNPPEPTEYEVVDVLFADDETDAGLLNAWDELVYSDLQDQAQAILERDL